MAMQRDFWVKNEVLGEMSVQKDFWVKNGVLGEWTCKGTFGLKLGFRGNGCAKGLLGTVGSTVIFFIYKECSLRPKKLRALDIWDP